MTEIADKKTLIWEIWYDVLFDPAAAMRSVAAAPRKGPALFSLITGLLPPWALYFAVGGTGSDLAGALLPLWLVLAIGFWFAAAALLHLAAVLAGGRGDASVLLCALGYVLLPQFFLIPAAAFAWGLPPGARMAGFIAGPALLLCWSLRLSLLALRYGYGLTAAKAALVLLVPIFLPAGIFLLAVAALGFGIFL